MATKQIIDYIPITWSTSEKTLSTIFRLHEVLRKNIIDYIPITWSTSEKLSTICWLHEVLLKKLSPIFRLHEVLPKKLSPIFRLHEVLRKKLSTIFRLHEVLRERINKYIPITWSTSEKIIQYIPITWSSSKKNYPLYSDYMKYFGKKLSTIFRLHEVLPKTSTIFRLHEVLRILLGISWLKFSKYLVVLPAGQSDVGEDQTLYTVQNWSLLYALSFKLNISLVPFDFLSFIFCCVTVVNWYCINIA